MVELPLGPSRVGRDARTDEQEREFWERRFDTSEAAPRPESRPERRPEQRGATRRDHRPVASPGLVERVVDRFHDWRGDARLGVIALVIVAVVAGFVWYRIGAGGAPAHGTAAAARAVVTTTEDGGVGVTTTAPGPAGTATKGGAARIAVRIAVHVAGTVVHPGVVELPAGARVIDAVEAVGGALPGGDLDRLNLAAKLSDGERVYVAKTGEADPGVTGGAGSADPGGGGSVTGGVAGGKVNLNTATQAQLEELPGVGPTYAQAIIAERQRRGGFKSVNELRTVRGIGDKRFAELAPLVTV